MSDKIIASSYRALSWGIIMISVIVPAVVAVLFFSSGSVIRSQYDFSFLPKLNAMLNLSTFFILLLAYYFVKSGKYTAHRLSMLTAVFLSTLFLVSYLTYHATSEATHFGGQDTLRYVYFILLISHILLAAALLPFVLFTLIRALRGKFMLHKKIARITWPIWLYVCVSGVLVYIMISPYYA